MVADRPRLVADLFTFEMPDGLGMQFRGAAEPVVIRGAQALASLSYLLPRLDGSRTVEELLAERPPDLPRPAVARVLALLEAKGLVVDGGDDEPAFGRTPDHASSAQLLFWGRKLGLTPTARTSGEVQRRLETTRLALVGTGLFGAAAYDLLARSGFRRMKVLAWDDAGGLLEALAASPSPPADARSLPLTSVDGAATALRGWIEETDLLVTATRNAPAALFEAVNRICLDRRCPWLRGNENASAIEIGPYVRPYESACYHCLALREASTHEHAIEEQLYERHLAEERPSGSTLPAGEMLAAATLGASLLVLEALRIVTAICPPTLLGAVLSVSPLDGGLRMNRLLRVPRCPECYPGGGAP